MIAGNPCQGWRNNLAESDNSLTAAILFEQGIRYTSLNKHDRDAERQPQAGSRNRVPVRQRPSVILRFDLSHHSVLDSLPFQQSPIALIHPTLQAGEETEVSR